MFGVDPFGLAEPGERGGDEEAEEERVADDGLPSSWRTAASSPVAGRADSAGSSVVVRGP